MKKYLYITFALLVSLFSSCSETNEENTEFDNWETRNDAYFADVYTKAKAAIANGDDSWRLVRGFSKNDASTKPTDFIVVKVLKKANAQASADSPLFTDSASVHYRGYLMPSDSYNTAVEGYPQNAGYQFDSSWIGNYNLASMTSSTQHVGSMIPGYTTALMSMREGERCLVYIPQALGYGSTSKETIPAYSTLIFDITLVKFWKKRLK